MARATGGSLGGVSKQNLVLRAKLAACWGADLDSVE